jgi:hypothetical protein
LIIHNTGCFIWNTAGALPVTRYWASSKVYSNSREPKPLFVVQRLGKNGTHIFNEENSSSQLFDEIANGPTSLSFPCNPPSRILQHGVRDDASTSKFSSCHVLWLT